ncbi:uncharacterized protein [Nicotiana sylvestris]|uniref:uncharacterized protein n=1 Tax=Nicotiana sylvestris TaxID=4096 RepID=UPI00388C89BF
MLKKDAATKWTDNCQKAFDKIKEYLSKPPVLVSPEPAQKLRHYFCAYTTYLISRMDPLKYIFQKPMPTGKLAKWQILLSEFDIVYVTQKVVKGQALVDHLAENPVDGGYEPLKMYFPDKEELRKRFTKTEFQHVPRIQNEFADALATLSSMIQHPDKNLINPIPVKIHNQPAYCAHVEEEADRKPWFYDIKEHLAKEEYPKLANPTRKCTLRRLSNNFFHSRGILYRRTPDLGLLRCVDAKEASRLLEEIHTGICGPYMNGFVLAKKILWAGYFWMTMETDCIQYVQKCHRCQIHVDTIKVPPSDLNTTSSLWSFATWGMDIIGPIEPVASNEHMFILVAIDYFTK